MKPKKKKRRIKAMSNMHEAHGERSSFGGGIYGLVHHGQ
jgi:hypothetical protein